MCLGALDRFHAPISNETHRPRHTHTHTNSMLGILSAQLPASDEKSMARGERRRDRRTKISKREICYNMPSLMVAGECSNSSYKTSFECFWLKKGFLRQHWKYSVNIPEKVGCGFSTFTEKSMHESSNNTCAPFERQNSTFLSKSYCSHWGLSLVKSSSSVQS